MLSLFGGLKATKPQIPRFRQDPKFDPSAICVWSFNFFLSCDQVNVMLKSGLGGWCPPVGCAWHKRVYLTRRHCFCGKDLTGFARTDLSKNFYITPLEMNISNLLTITWALKWKALWMAPNQPMISGRIFGANDFDKIKKKIYRSELHPSQMPFAPFNVF